MSSAVLTPQQTTQLRNWIAEQLDRLLGFSSDDVIDNLLGNVTEAEFDRFANELLGSETTAVRFIQRLKSRRQEFNTLQFARPVQSGAPANAKAYRKSDASQVTFLAAANKKSKKQVHLENVQSQQRQLEKFEAQKAAHDAIVAAVEDSRKIRHPAHRCECQASRHPLVTNCSSCGRIVCEREAGDYCLFCGFWLNTKYDGPLTEAERSAEIHKQKLLLFDRDSERRTRVFDDQADYFSTDTEAWLDPAELAARRKLRAEVEAARQRQRSTLTVTFDFAGRQVVSHADDADRAALDKRFGVVEQQSSSVGDAELEKRLAAELDEVERVKLISMTDKSVPSTAVAPAGAAASSSSSVATSSVDVHLSTAPIAPLQIKPSDNIEMRPIALPRESHHASEASKKSASKNNNNNENKQSKRGKSNVSTAVAGAGGKKRHEKVQSEHDELF